MRGFCATKRLASRSLTRIESNRTQGWSSKAEEHQILMSLEYGTYRAQSPQWDNKNCLLVHVSQLDNRLQATEEHQPMSNTKLQGSGDAKDPSTALYFSLFRDSCSVTNIFGSGEARKVDLDKLNTMDEIRTLNVS